MPRVGLTKDKIVRHAFEVANVTGFDQLNLGQLARELGVRPPGLYKHVGGLDDIKREISLLALGQLREALCDSVMGRSGKEALVALAHAFRRFAQEKPGAFASTARAPIADDEEWQQAAWSVVETVIRAIRGFHLPEDHVIHTIRAIRSALHGFVALEQGRGFGLPEKLDTSFALLVDILVEGIQARSPSTVKEPRS